MDEYIVLAQDYTNTDADGFPAADWKVGTFEQVKYWLEKWEADGMVCQIRKCTRPLNIEFVRAGIDKVAMA